MSVKNWLVLAISASYFAASTSWAASCIPVSNRGEKCVSLIDNTSKPRYDGGTTYTLKFRNICNKIFTVKAQRSMHLDRGDDGVSSTGVRPNGESEIVCTDIPSGRKCAGFREWWVDCY